MCNGNGIILPIERFFFSIHSFNINYQHDFIAVLFWKYQMQLCYEVTLNKINCYRNHFIWKHVRILNWDKVAIYIYFEFITGQNGSETESSDLTLRSTRSTSSLGKASKKGIFITLGSDPPPLESDKNIFYFFWIQDHFLSTFWKNVFLPLEKLKTL